MKVHVFFKLIFFNKEAGQTKRVCGWDLAPKLQFFTMDKMIHPRCFLTSATCAYICNYFLHKIFQKHFKKLKIFSHNQYVLCSVTQLCTTLFDPIDYSPPSSSVHGDSPDKNTEVVFHALLQVIFLTQGSNWQLLCFLHWQMGTLPLVTHQFT